MKSRQKIAIARRCLAALAHACRAMCAGCGGLRRLANAPGPAKLSDRRRLGSDGLPEPIAPMTADCVEGGQGVITEFCNASQPLIGHLYDALGQDRLRRERVGWFREVAAKTFQERPTFLQPFPHR